VSVITNNNSAEPWVLTWRERREACAIANFFRRSRAEGHSQAVIFHQIDQVWPSATPAVLAAAELLAAVRAEGWPPT
jgi:hypothetical protein